MAPPIDRLAAIMADLVLLLPLLSLVLSPLRRRWELAELLRDTESLRSIGFSMVLGAALATTVFNTIFLSLWGATPGKRLLGLRVRSFWTHAKPTPKQAFIRSMFWCAEVFLFCLPWLGALSNNRRRPWHDRIADTEVVCNDPRKAVGAPDLRELGLASSIQIACLCAFFLVTSLTLLRGARDRKDGDIAAVTTTGDKSYLCSSVSEAHEEWLSIEGEAPSRVEVALALFGADVIGDRCLLAEAEYALWNGKASASAYLAKALAMADDAEASHAYTRKTCDLDPNGAPCRVARMRLEPEHGRLPAAVGHLKPVDASELKQALAQKAPAYMRVFAVEKLIAGSRHEEALKLIDSGSPHRRLGYFYASHRAQALWSLHRTGEARLAFRSALEGLPASQRLRLARWFCDAENLSSCGDAAAHSCELLSKAVDKAPGELEEMETAVAWIRAQECVAGRTTNYQKMRTRVPGPDAQSFLSALAKLQANDRQGARKELEQVLADSPEESPFWFEAQSRLVAMAETEGDLKPIFDRWNKSDSGETGWLRVGHLLLQRFESLGQTKRVVEVGSRLLDWNPFDEDLRRRLVVWAYHSGEVQTALRALEKLKNPSSGAAEVARAPASASLDMEFERVARELAGAVLTPPPDTLPRQEMEP